MKTVAYIITLALAMVVVAGCSGWNAQAPNPNTGTATITTPNHHVPVPSDFAVKVTQVSQSCGNGCVSGYLLVIDYTGPSIAPHTGYMVTYDVSGASFGANGQDSVDMLADEPATLTGYSRELGVDGTAAPVVTIVKVTPEQ